MENERIWAFLSLQLFLLGVRFHAVFGQTDPQDAAALRSVSDQWVNAPPKWGTSYDPCGAPWEGVICSNSRVTDLRLPTMGIKGTLSGDIAQLSVLKSLDLSNNNDLGGPLTPHIGNLQQLTTLILLGCSFSGSIPSELGTLPLLSFIAINSNQFTGNIPASLGNLSKLYWLDLADNQLSGPLPISSSSGPGLDLLVNTKHFHFNKNKLSGIIPAQLFNSKMNLLHVLFDSNQFNGTIPATVGLVETLEVLRLDRNQLTGPIPSSIGNLTGVYELNLANNNLNGTIPDLSGMISLNYLDLSNNSFIASETPKWLTQITSLTSLAVESGGLQGELSGKLFSFPQLQQVLLKNNSLNGTLDLRGRISPQLQVVDLENNNISFVAAGGGNRVTLMLAGNPICESPAPGTSYCLLQQQPRTPYFTSLTRCGATTCSQDQSISPSSCTCAIPYKGLLIFRAPSFSDLTNSTRFQSLETTLWTILGLSPHAVSLSNLLIDNDNYLDVQVSLFPSDGIYFNHSEIERLGFSFSNQTYQPPPEFGPYFFIASSYPFPVDGSGSHSMISASALAGIVVGCGVLLTALVLLGVFAFKQRKMAERATELAKPFASWGMSSKDTGGGGAPQLKGARWFYLDDLKKCTKNFSESSEIGSGGYGKVYKGILPDGQVVAIKRSQKGSTQGGEEFKTEIELLSRVHHKNLVGLVGFCFEQGEQTLVYEFIPNGTLRENLAGKTAAALDWKRRLRIALGSARGLAYLHELADPPIIHRDVKSTNILLDENLTAKVADFGLSKLMLEGEKGHISTQVKGTPGYLDPEYFMTMLLTDKSDVYSFGVVMLELITSKLPIERGIYIVREVKLAFDENDELCGLVELMDPALQDSPNLIGFRKFVELALHCVQESASARPTMNEVVKEIENILKSDNSSLSSVSGSTMEFSCPRGPSHNTYIDHLLKKDTSSDSFKNSTGYPFSDDIQPI